MYNNSYRIVRNLYESGCLCFSAKLISTHFKNSLPYNFYLNELLFTIQENLHIASNLLVVDNGKLIRQL